MRIPLVFCKIPKDTISQLASFCRKDFPALLLCNKNNDKRWSDKRKIKSVVGVFYHYGFMHLSMLRLRMGRGYLEGYDTD